MSSGYDMNVEYRALCDVESKLKKIEDNLNASSEKMRQSILRSQDYLSGNQFENAKITTQSCVTVVNKTTENLRRARNYAVSLREALELYGECKYQGD